MDIPDGAIPVDQFAAAPSAQPEVPAQQAANTDGIPDGAIPIDQFESHEDKYDTAAQGAGATAEGFARGVAGPVATFVEKHMMGIPEEDIKSREEVHPIKATLGEVGGLIGSTVAGVGLGSVMTKAGEAAVGLTKAGQALEAATTGAKALGASTAVAAEVGEAAMAAQPLISKVGSTAVQQAAEMAVLQSGNEIHKMILNDPEQSAQSAIANIGLASALGAGTGAFITGAISPLWKATAAEPLDKGLNALKNHLNGAGRTIPEDIELASQTLGIEIPKTVRGANVSDANRATANHLKRMENAEFLAGEHKMAKDISDSVAQSLNMDVELVANYSKHEAGEELANSFFNSLNKKYETFGPRYAAEAAENAKIMIPDQPRLSKYERLLDQGMQTFGTDSPYYKVYDDYAQRILAKDTVGGLDQLISEVNGKLKAAYRSAEGTEIKTTIQDLKDAQITRMGNELETLGAKGAAEMSVDKIAEREALNSEYAEFKTMMRELSQHLGISEPSGAGALKAKLGDKVAPEDLLKMFSVKGDHNFTKFLEKQFPAELNLIKTNELKELIKPAVLKAKGDHLIDVNKLADIVAKGNAGNRDLINTVLSPEMLAKIEAAQTMQKAFVKPINSGTPKGLMDAIAHYPAAAMSIVAGYLGHNPLFGGILGSIGQYVGKDMPDAIKLAMLKFSASDQPVKAEGFKAMVEFMHQTIKGETMLNKAVTAVLKPSAQVIAANAMNIKASNEKLDKMVVNYNNYPESLMNKSNGQTGHYLPAHQAGLTQATTQAMQYLQALKPMPHQTGPLDTVIQPTAAEQARYQRALTIANSPASVLEHVKNGTIQVTDIADLKAMYPALYDNMSQKLTNEFMNRVEGEEPIPYKTRMGMSLFLGQAMDSSMKPESIMAAQPKPKPQPTQGTSMKNLGKSNSNYMTPEQSAEAHKSNRHK